MNNKNNASRYRTVPVDLETHRMILALCDAYDMGLRAQGALVRRLIKAEYHQLAEQQGCLNPGRKVVENKTQE